MEGETTFSTEPEPEDGSSVLTHTTMNAMPAEPLTRKEGKPLVKALDIFVVLTKYLLYLCSIYHGGPEGVALDERSWVRGFPLG